MSRKWSGDGSHKLPAQQVEPYRLWFEFLKLASRDPDVRVNGKLYAAWGDYETLTFDQWWSPNWRRLFAVDVGVYELKPSDAQSLPASSDSLLVRIPLYQDPKRSLAQVAEILKANNASHRLRDMPAGQFHLNVGEGRGGKLIHPSTRFLRNLSKVRLLMHLYRFWVQHQGEVPIRRLEKTTLSYLAWAEGWNTKVKEKKWNRPLIEVPSAIRAYAKYVRERAEAGRLRLYDGHDDHTNHRRQVARYIEKAQRLAANAGRGVFPGQYERAVSPAPRKVRQSRM